MSTSNDQLLQLLEARFEQQRQDLSELQRASEARIIAEQHRSNAAVYAEVNSLKQQLENDRGRYTRQFTHLEQLCQETSRTSTLNSSSFTTSLPATRWHEETSLDTSTYNEISGYTFIKPRDSSQASSPYIIASTLSTDKDISPHPTVRGAYRLDVGSKGRAGTLATGDFLRAVKGRIPPRLNVQREKTRLTILRNKIMQPAQRAITDVINTQPSLTGLKTHVGGNACNLFLSYHERNNALDYKNKEAQAYTYPIWEHVPFEQTMNNGRGGFDFTTTINLTTQTIMENIKAILPPTNNNDAPGDVNMAEAGSSRQSRGRDSRDSAGTDRNQQRRLGSPRNTNNNV